MVMCAWWAHENDSGCKWCHKKYCWFLVRCLFSLILLFYWFLFIFQKYLFFLSFFSLLTCIMSAAYKILCKNPFTFYSIILLTWTQFYRKKRRFKCRFSFSNRLKLSLGHIKSIFDTGRYKAQVTEIKISISVMTFIQES